MIFQMRLSWQLLAEPYGVFLILVLVSVLLNAVSCALIFGACLRKTQAFSKTCALYLTAMALVLSADLARQLEWALHAGLFSLRAGATHILVAFFLWRLVSSFLKEQNGRKI